MDLTVKSDVKPSLFNKDMAIGAMVGDIVGAMVGILAGGPPGAIIGRPIGIVLGGWIGGARRKQQMQEEALHGKKLKPPTAFNKDTLLGGLLGFVATGLLMQFAVGAMIAMGVSVPVVGVTALALTVGSVGAAVLGAVMGGKHGKAIMEKEYNAAMDQYVQREVARSHSLSHEVECEHAPSKNFAVRLERERQEMAAQAPQKC